MLTLYILMLILAVTLFIVGRIGKRIDDHPLCKKCGFDFFNKPQTSANCPECGRNVTLPKGSQSRL